MEMSIYDPKYPAGTEATISSASGGKHVVKLIKKGLKEIKILNKKIEEMIEELI